MNRKRPNDIFINYFDKPRNPAYKKSRLKRFSFTVLAVKKVLTAPIFLNLRNFGTKRDKKAQIKLIDLTDLAISFLALGRISWA